MVSPRSLDNPEGSVPVPDPTLLTTAALIREIGNLRELIDAKFDNIHNELRLIKELRISQRDDDMKRVEIQLRERDIRLEQMTRGNEVSLAAALSAQKELYDRQNMANTIATTKSEAAFTKQIDQITLLLQAANKATDDKIDDLKERAQLNEGHQKGAGDLWGVIVGVIGVVCILGTFAVLILSRGHAP